MRCRANPSGAWAIHSTILIADDDRVTRGHLAQLLRKEGYEVVPARDGLEALAFIEVRDFDLILLDVQMPGLDGFSVCRAVKERAETRLVPVVMVTVLDDLRSRIDGINAGADDFLTKPVNRLELIARVKSLVRLKTFTDELENAELVLSTLALSIEAKDAYTEAHCRRLVGFSVALAQRLGRSEAECIALRRGSRVHDIGKVAVPENVLRKAGPLSGDEWQLVKDHCVIGERICRPMRSFRDVLPIIRSHHEKLDGSGYPDGLKADQIPFTARLLQVVDIYDALTTDRPYRKGLSSSNALQILKEEAERGWRDGSIVEDLKELVVAGPPGITIAA